MKKLILISLLATACGSSKVATVEPCFYADYITNGVCVLTNGYDIDRDMIDFVVDTTEEAFNRVLERDDDLPVLLEQIKTSVEYVDRRDSRLKLEDKYVRGLTKDREILVHIAKEDDLDTVKCIEQYYVFGHELLHVMAKHILKTSGAHNIPNIFITWAYENDIDTRLTVELYVYAYTVYKCEDLHGKLPEDW